MRITAATIGDQLRSKGLPAPKGKNIRVVIPKDEFIEKLHPARRVQVDKLASIGEQLQSKSDAYLRLKAEMKEWYNKQIRGLAIDWKLSFNPAKESVFIFNDDVQDSWLTGDWSLRMRAKVRITASIIKDEVVVSANLKIQDGTKKILDKSLVSDMKMIDAVNQPRLEKFYMKLYRFVSDNLTKSNKLITQK